MDFSVFPSAPFVCLVSLVVALTKRLCAYFRSGWAFLIPYLAAYLLYAGLGGPVLPGGRQGWAPIPCLLHVYWFLHLLHLGLGFLAVRFWWETGAAGEPATASPWARTSRLLPWICLGLVFWIPGPYLEFPADNWEHLSRIFEWGDVSLVRDHHYWTKSGYFFTYSLLGWLPLHVRFGWLGLYEAGASLLLCWQYFRLARALKLQTATATVLVVAQVLLFGNDIFSFHRYYGISSSLPAQVGAVALVRLVLEVLQRSAPTGQSMGGERGTVAGNADPGVGRPAFAFAVAALLLLVAFNHVQGLGLAGLGIAAGICWRLVSWRRSMLLALPAIAGALSLATVLWWPRAAVIDQIYRPQGWMNTWHGFNLLAPASPAGSRAQDVLGLIGLANLAAGFYLLRRNQLIGWLTVLPVCLLCLPVVAIPMANVLGRANVANIVTFHRMLFAIPCGLALGALATAGFEAAAAGLKHPLQPPCRSFAFSAILTALVVFMVLPERPPYHNRLWNLLAVVPKDLRLGQVLQQTSPATVEAIAGQTTFALITPRDAGIAAHAIGMRGIPYHYRARAIIPPAVPSRSADDMVAGLQDLPRSVSVLFSPPATNLFTPVSLAGYLSGHWNPQQAALEFVPNRALAAAVRASGWTEIHRHGQTYFLFTPAKP